MSEECSHCGATALESADCAMNGCPFGADETEITLRRRIAALEAERDEARARLLDAHHAIVHLDEDIFGPILDAHGEHCGWVRDELLAKIRACL